MNPTLRRALALFLTVAVGLSALTAWRAGGGGAAAAMVPLDAPPVEMVVLMYHSVMSKQSRAGDYIITPAAFEDDLKYIRSQGFTTVVMEDIIAYVKEGRPLPERPIMITFDDGYYNNYLNVYPLLQKYQMKAVISIIGAETDKYSERPEEKSESYSHITWDMIREMQESGLVEVQNHSYNLHKVSQKRKGSGKSGSESQEEYQAMLREDLGKLQDRFAQMTEVIPTTYAYPFGSVSKYSYQVVEEMFEASLDAQGRLFCLTRDESCLWRIPRYNRPWGTTAEKIIKKAYATSKTKKEQKANPGTGGDPSASSVGK